MKHIKLIPVLLMIAGILLLFSAVIFRDAARVLLSAVISVLLLGYLLYLILHRELKCTDQEESVLYLELGKKPRLCLLYIQKEPSEEELCAYQSGHFVKLRIQQTDRFLCPLDVITLPGGTEILILKKIHGSFFNEKKYQKAAAFFLAMLLIIGSVGIGMRLASGRNLMAFLEKHTEQIFIQPVTGTLYNQNDAFQDFQFLLTVCESPEHTAAFLKLFCISGDSYQLRMISLNPALFLNGHHLGGDVDTCLSEKNYAEISRIIAEYFKIRIDHLIIMNYDSLCDMAQDACISLTVDKSLYHMKYVSPHREQFAIDGNYNYQEAVNLIADLQSYTEQCIAEGSPGTLYLEQMIAELQNDLIYDLLIKIARGQQKNAAVDCLLTDMTKEQVNALNHVIHYKQASFLNQLRNPGSQTMIPYLSDCKLMQASDGYMLAYVPDGFTDSRIIKEFYYTLAGK